MQATDLEHAVAISQQIQRWGIWRDTGQWDVLRSLYTADARMKTTWFDGPASAFVDISIRKFGGPSLVLHVLSPSVVDVCGARAVAETRVTLMTRGLLHEVAVDVTCWGRFIDRLVLDAGRWLIQDRTPVYEKDAMVPVEPGRTVPIDRERFMRHPSGYRHLAYMQSLAGLDIVLDLPAHNSAEQRTLYEENAEWLRRT